MVSSVSAFGGLSAANLLTLFGANASLSSTPASAASSATIGVFASGANDSAKTIQAILAKAQIEKAPAATSSCGSPVSAIVAAAYAAQMGGASTLTGPIRGLLTQAEAVQAQPEQAVATATYVDELATASATTAYAARNAQGSVTSYSSEQGGTSMWGDADSTGQEQASRIFSSLGATSVSLAQASGAPRSDPVDSFQVALAVDNHSVAFGFTLDGLGEVQRTDTGYSAGQGPLADYFQAVVDVGGHGMVFEFNIRGLDATQARQVTAAFEKATTTQGTTSLAKDTSSGGTNQHQYSVNYGAGLSVSFMDMTGYQPTGGGL